MTNDQRSDSPTSLHPGSSAPRYTVYKHDHAGHEVWQYPGRLLERGPHFMRLEAFFDRADIELGYAVFRRGDRFVETYYDDRWYNVFAVYDGDGESLKGWYCNICRPARITDTAVRFDDLALDVWVSPAGETLVLDEEEFAALPIPAGERSAALAALAAILSLAENGRLPR